MLPNLNRLVSKIEDAPRGPMFMRGDAGLMRDALDGMLQDVADLRAWLEELRNDMDGYYDGAPDSPHLWMGRHLTKLDGALKDGHAAVTDDAASTVEE